MPQQTYFLESNLLSRRQQSASYMQQLDLPSLPPLSQMLTDRAATTETKIEQQPEPSKVTATSAVVPSATLMQLPQPVFFDYTLPPTSMASTTDVPVPSDLYAPTSTTALMHQPFLPLDSFSGLPADPATAAAAMASAAGTTYGGGQVYQRPRHPSESSMSSADKVYAFVPIPDVNHKKRPRRRYDEIERLYHCTWKDCTKSYGTLNHLNAHVSMQKHGPKRHPSEFKEMRKEWRRQKKEREAARKAAEEEQKKLQEQAAVEVAAATALLPPPPSQVMATVSVPFQGQPYPQSYNQLHSMSLSEFY